NTIDPIPLCEAIISAETSNRSDVPAASFNPAKIIGNDPGKITLRITLNGLEPNVTAALINISSTFLTPENVLITTGKKTPKAIIVTLESSPIPNHKINRGNKAIFGIG